MLAAGIDRPGIGLRNAGTRMEALIQRWAGREDYGPTLECSLKPAARWHCNRMAGYSSLCGNTRQLGNFWLLRYLPTGSLDNAFGTGGKVMADVGEAIMQGTCVCRVTEK